jgi:hypothetical protein
LRSKLKEKNFEKRFSVSGPVGAPFRCGSNEILPSDSKNTEKNTTLANKIPIVQKQQSLSVKKDISRITNRPRLSSHGRPIKEESINNNGYQIVVSKDKDDKSGSNKTLDSQRKFLSINIPIPTDNIAIDASSDRDSPGKRYEPTSPQKARVNSGKGSPGKLVGSKANPKKTTEDPGLFEPGSKNKMRFVNDFLLGKSKFVRKHKRLGTTVRKPEMAISA